MVFGHADRIRPALKSAVQFLDRHDRLRQFVVLFFVVVFVVVVVV